MVLLRIKEATYDQSPVFCALTYAGILGFNNDFITLSESDIGTLTVPGAAPTDGHVPLPIGTKHKLIILLAFYQAACRKVGGCINIGGAKLA